MGYALKKRFVEEPVNLAFPAWAGFIVLGDILVFVPIFIFVSACMRCRSIRGWLGLSLTYPSRFSIP